MSRLPRSPLVAAIAAALAGILLLAWARADSNSGAKTPQRGLHVVADGLNRPTWAGAAPGDDALWVAEQPGRLLRIHDDEHEVVADLTSSIRLDAEQGLLGVAFGPDFATRRDLYLHFSDVRGDTRVVELRVDDENRAHQRRVLLAVDQPYDNHNGGALAFGPDGRLYLGLGDGGGTNDPGDRAQDPDSPLGKLLAADVRTPGRPRWDIVAYGLRNPWRFSFDLALGHAWIGDVGQDAQEEIDRVRVHERGRPPPNLGWPAYEGTEHRAHRRLRGDGRLEAPAVTYSHRLGCSVTGGLIHHGEPERLDGRYLYGDFCTGRIWSVLPGPGEEVGAPRRERFRIPQLTHIGTDDDGRLVFASADGVVRALAG